VSEESAPRHPLPLPVESLQVGDESAEPPPSRYAERSGTVKKWLDGSPTH